MFVDGVIHLFRGLTRPLMHRGNMTADRDVLVYSWVPMWDWEWRGNDVGNIRPPSNKVFTVIVRPFEKPDSDGILGEVLHWGWMDESPSLKGAPVDHETRFTELVWSKRTKRE